MTGKRFRARLVVLVALAGLLAAGCGEATRRHPYGGASATCHAAGVPAECLRAIARVVRVRSIVLAAGVAEQVRASLSAAARETRIEVVCPPLVPAGGVVSNPDLYGRRSSTDAAIPCRSTTSRIQAASDWEFAATAGPATRLWVLGRANWDAQPPNHRTRVIGHRGHMGYRITLYRFPDNDGQLEGARRRVRHPRRHLVLRLDPASRCSSRSCFDRSDACAESAQASWSRRIQSLTRRRSRSAPRLHVADPPLKRPRVSVSNSTFGGFQPERRDR